MAVTKLPVTQPNQQPSGMAPGTQPQPSVRAHFPPVQQRVAAAPKAKMPAVKRMAGGINRAAFFGR